MVASSAQWSAGQLSPQLVKVGVLEQLKRDSVQRILGLIQCCDQRVDSGPGREAVADGQVGALVVETAVAQLRCCREVLQ